MADPPAWPSSHPSRTAWAWSCHGATVTADAVGQHDHDPRVDGRHRLEQLDLCGGQVHVGAVVALGLVRRGQPEEHDGDVGGGSGARPPRSTRAGSPASDSTTYPGANVTSRRPASAVREGVQGVVQPGRVDLRAAGALVAGRAGELADHGDRAGRRRRPAGAARRRSSAARRSPRPPRGPGRGGRRRRPGRRAPHGPAGRGRPGRGRGRRRGRRPPRTACRSARRPGSRESRRRSPTASPGPARRRPRRRGSLTAPQSDTTRPSNPHSLAQHRAQQPRVLRGVDAVDPVVGAHDRPRLRGA